MRKKRRIRLTPLGYVVAAGLTVVILAILVLSLRSCGSKTAKEEEPKTTEGSLLTETDAPGLAESTPDPGQQAIATPVPYTPSPTPSPTPVPTPEPKPTSMGAFSILRTPSPQEEKTAREGKLNNSGVVLRAAPRTDGKIFGKYRAGTRLKIYGEEGDYYFVQVVKENQYGYMAKKFVSYVVSEEGTVTGAVTGTVSASVAALRKAPDLSDDTNKIGQITNGESVLIQYQYTNDSGDTFYYLEVEKTGTKAFVVSKFIKADDTVPQGKP